MAAIKSDVQTAGSTEVNRRSFNRWMREVQAAEQDLDQAEARLEHALAKLRSQCVHERISEAKEGWEPFRICEDCGIEERHGSTGFRVLTGDRVRHVGSIFKLWSLRKSDELGRVYWCYGNLFFPEHAVLKPLAYGRMNGDPQGEATRCCETHDLDYAEKVLDFMPPSKSKRIDQMSDEELTSWLEKYQAAHPPHS